MKYSHCDLRGMVSLSQTAIVRSAVIKKPRFIHRLIVRTDRINDGDTISLDTIPLKA